MQIDGSGRMLFGAGEYMPPAGRLKALRQHMVDDAAGFKKVLKNKKLKLTFGDIRDEGKLMRPPKGFDPEHEHIEYIKLKSFFIWTEIDLPLNQPELLVPILASGFKDAFPLVEWMRAAKEEIVEE